ncbi:MAG TPA: HAMP domain-containing sensor histidine kinase [Actinomycetota bacterium]|jgi:signal transduction histidine kinase|nr:HAMP domain-containing sensor histidine kinase [Actinomycetota bacterium]
MHESDLRDVSLVAVTSHEMRAPLAAIRGFVDMLQRKRSELSDAEVDEFLQVIAVQTQRLIRLADDLVTMESLQDSTLALEHEPIVLVPALEQLVRHLPDGDRVEVRVSADAPPTIESDALRLAQVLTNLLTNALKYSKEGSDVVLEAGPAGEGCLGIAVIDHGIGIDADERERVFEPFYRTTEGARSGEGSGLGLAIARRLVEALGGRISAEPTPGGGTTFRVTLPVRAAAR